MHLPANQSAELVVLLVVNTAVFVGAGAGSAAGADADVGFDVVGVGSGAADPGADAEIVGTVGIVVVGPGAALQVLEHEGIWVLVTRGYGPSFRFPHLR